MKIYSLDESINTGQSVLKHLSETYIYRNDINSGTLSTYYSGLALMVGFPTDLEHLTMPTIALTLIDSPPAEFYAYGGRSEKFFPYRLDIFAGGETTNGLIDEHKNTFMRDRMLNDVKNLLEENMGETYVKLYNFADIISSGTAYDTGVDFMVSDVSGSALEPTGETEADKYRAIVDFTASLIYSQD